MHHGGGFAIASGNFCKHRGANAGLVSCYQTKVKEKPRHLRGAVCVVHSEAGWLCLLCEGLIQSTKVQQLVSDICAVASAAAIKVAKWRVLFAVEQQQETKIGGVYFVA